MDFDHRQGAVGYEARGSWYRDPGQSPTSLDLKRAPQYPWGEVAKPETLLQPAGGANMAQIRPAHGHFETVDQPERETFTVALDPVDGRPRDPIGPMDPQPVDAAELGECVGETVENQVAALDGVDAQIVILRLQAEEIAPQPARDAPKERRGLDGRGGRGGRRARALAARSHMK